MKSISFFLNIFKSNTFTTWLSYGSKSLNFLIVLPIVLKNFSPQDITFWYLISNFFFIILIIDSGFSNTFIRMLAYGTVGNRNILSSNGYNTISNQNTNNYDFEFVNSVIFVMKSFYKNIIIIIFFSSFFIGYLAFETPVTNSSNPTLGWIVCLILQFSFPFLIWGGVYSNVLQGMNKIPSLRLGETIFNFLSSCTSIIILVINPSIYYISISFIIWSLLAVARNYILVLRIDRLKVKIIDIGLFQKIKDNVISNSIKSGFGVLFSQGITYFMGFFYANKLNPEISASFLVTINLVNNLKTFAQAPFYSKIPYFSSLVASNKMPELITFVKRSMRLVYLVFVVLSVIIWYFLYFYSEYNGNNSFKPNLVLYFLLVFGFFIERFGAMHIQLYSMSNHILWHIQNGVTGLITIIATIVVFNYSNVMSYPIGLVIGNVFFYSWFGSYYSMKFLKISFWEFEKNVFLPFLLIAIFIGILVFINANN